MVDFQLFNTGFCTSIEKLAVVTAPWRRHKFPALFALIRDPHHGNILFDTGHSSRFFELTKQFPRSIYRWLISVEHDRDWDAAHQLTALGIPPESINYIIISHFHADHIGGLRDFPKAKFIYLQEAYQAVSRVNALKALKLGFLPGLIPEDFVQRSYLLNDCPVIALTEEYFPFKVGYQVFGRLLDCKKSSNDTIIAVALPGHADGQIGLFLSTADNKKIFLIADACWTSQSYLECLLPHPVSFSVLSSRRKYIKTLSDIHTLYQTSPHITIIPSHCMKMWNEFKDIPKENREY